MLAHYLLDAGESAASRAALEAFDASSVEGDLRAELLRDRGYGLWYEGERDAGYRLVLDALEHARDDGPRCAHAYGPPRGSGTTATSTARSSTPMRRLRCSIRRSIRDRTPGRSSSAPTSDS